MQQVKHLEMYDSEMFCDSDAGSQPIDYVPQHEWHFDARCIAEATCPGCLSYLAELGLEAQGVMFDAYQKAVAGVLGSAEAPNG